MLQIRSKSKQLSIGIDHGQPISFLIQQAGMSLDLQCSGLGICKKCAVKLGPGDYLVENRNLTVAEGESVKALSCRTKILSDKASVFVPDEAILKSEGKIYDDFLIPDFNFQPLTRKFFIKVPEAVLENVITDWKRMHNEIRKQCHEGKNCKNRDVSCCLNILQKLPLLLDKNDELTVTVGQIHNQCHIIDIEPGDTSQKNLGVAVDIGTTTVVLILVDMNTGKILAKASLYNQQMSRADDVASRISVASSGPEQLKYMKDLVINDTINPLIKSVCEQSGNSPEDIFRLVVSGNTVMAHLFLGLSPKSIGAIPFQPVTNIYADCLGEDLGLLMHSCGIVNIVPSVAGYVGGDITSDIYVSGALNDNTLSAVVDLGTNSEMVLVDDGKFYACAAAAGPAFEGAGLICGCRATPGAIEHITYDTTLEFDIKTIGDAPPIGICGSAIIDFIANGFLCGLINKMGRFNVEMLQKNNRYLYAETSNGNSHACIIVPTENSAIEHPIIVTESDLEQILKAKAAVYAGLKTMLSERNHTFNDLNKLVLAGGFAKYIDINNAIRIGMLPEINSEKITSIGNGSLGGAYLALIDPTAKSTYYEIIKKPEIVQLNMIPDFEISFVDALMLPNYDETEFPDTISKLNN